MEEFKLKFKLNTMTIYESKYWIWSLRPQQATLGSSILSLKRSEENFSDLSTSEFLDMKNLINVIEKTLKETFNYDKINYLMLMMVDNQVHYHVLPRYKTKINIFGEEWIDSEWPAIPNLNGEELNITELTLIKNKLINNLK